MAFTKINAAGIGTTETVTVDGLTVINNESIGGNLTVTGNATISGVLTYEDVTNVDSVGLITARNGVVVGSGITLSKDGDVFFTGIATGNGSGLTALNASNLASGTVPTARLGSGTASSSTFLRGDSTFATVTSTTINNNADNRVITGSGTANTLNGESTLTYNGSGALNVLGASGNTQLSLTRSDANTSGTTGTIGFYASDNHAVAGLYALGDGDNEGAHLVFKTTSAASGTSVYSNVDERLRITSAGYVGIGEDSPDNILHVNSGATNTAAKFESTDTEVAIQLTDTTGSSVIKARNDFRFDNSTGELARIDSSGRFGLGTSSPDTLLHLNASSGSTLQRFQSSSYSSYIAQIQSDDNVSNGANAGELHLRGSSGFSVSANNGTATHFHIKSDGRIGLGNDLSNAYDSTYNQVVIGNGADSNNGITFHVGTSSGTYLGFKDTTDGTVQGLISYTHADNNLSFHTNGTEHIEIESGGALRFLGSQTRSASGTNSIISHGNNSLDFNGTEYMYFRINGTERARFQTSNNGYFQIGRSGNTPANAQLGVAVSNSVCAIQTISDGSSGHEHIRFNNTNGEVGRITTSGSGTTYYTSSDYRLKENDVAISDGVTRVKQLRPIKFNWKANPSETVEGFFAHEVQAIVPEAVDRSKDQVVTQADIDEEKFKQDQLGDPLYQAYDASRLVPLLTAAVKELITRVENLESA